MFLCNCHLIDSIIAQISHSYYKWSSGATAWLRNSVSFVSTFCSICDYIIITFIFWVCSFFTITQNKKMILFFWIDGHCLWHCWIILSTKFLLLNLKLTCTKIRIFKIRTKIYVMCLHITYISKCLYIVPYLIRHDTKHFYLNNKMPQLHRSKLHLNLIKFCHLLPYDIKIG